MNNSLLFTFVPLLVFVLADAFAGPKTGIYLAIISSIGILIYEYLSMGSIDKTSFIEPALILILGVISLKMRSPKAFLLQPCVVALVLVLFLSYYQFFDVPYLVKQLPLLQKMAPEEAKLVLDKPAFATALTTISLQLIPLFAAHGGLMLLLALREKRVHWIIGRLLIYPGLFIVMAWNFALFLR